MHTNLSHFAALRRHTRMPARIPVRLKTHEASLDTVTADVSASGAFVMCEHMGTLHVDDVLHLRFWLPDSLEYVTLTARVARVGVHQGKVGCGVVFEGCTAHALEDWERFVDRMMHLVPPSGSWSIPEEVEHTWYGLSLDALDELANVDIFIGGIFVRCTAACAEGTRVRLMLVHPVDQSRLRVNTKVTGCRRHGERGLCLSFCEPVQILRARLQGFIEEGVPCLDFDEVLLRRATQELLMVS